MTFGLAPPKIIANLFGNWLKGIPKKDLIQVRVSVCAVIWALWNTRNDFMFNKPKKLLPTSYPYGCPLDPYVVLSPTRGASGGDGFRVQLVGDGRSRFIQPVRVAIA
jgi:hypothetical protein